MAVLTKSLLANVLRSLLVNVNTPVVLLNSSVDIFPDGDLVATDS